MRNLCVLGDFHLLSTDLSLDGLLMHVTYVVKLKP